MELQPVPPLPHIRRGERNPQFYLLRGKNSRNHKGHVAILSHAVRIEPMTCFGKLTEHLVRRGITVVIPVLSGHENVTPATVSANKKAVLRDGAPPEGPNKYSVNDHIADLVETISMVAGMDGIRPDRTLVYGHSFSGYLVPRAVARLRPEIPRPRTVITHAAPLYPDRLIYRGPKGELLDLRGEVVPVDQPFVRSPSNNKIARADWESITTDWTNMPRTLFDDDRMQQYFSLRHDVRTSAALAAVRRITEAKHGTRLIVLANGRDDAFTSNVTHSYQDAAIGKRTEAHTFPGVFHLPDHHQWVRISPRMTSIIGGALTEPRGLSLSPLPAVAGL